MREISIGRWKNGKFFIYFLALSSQDYIFVPGQVPNFGEPTFRSRRNETGFSSVRQSMYFLQIYLLSIFRIFGLSPPSPQQSLGLQRNSLLFEGPKKGCGRAKNIYVLTYGKRHCGGVSKKKTLSTWKCGRLEGLGLKKMTIMTVCLRLECLSRIYQ